MGVPGARHRKSLEIFQNLLKGGQDPSDAPPMDAPVLKIFD